MKSWSKVVVLFLCSVFLFTIVGCDANKSLKVIDSGDFEDALEELDYDVTVVDEDYLNDGEEEGAYVSEEDLVVAFIKYEDEEDAVAKFDDLFDNLQDAKDDEDFNGTSSKTTGKNYQKMVINGESDDSTDEFSEGSAYMVIFQIENTFISVIAYDNGKSDIKDVDEIVKELGY